MVYVAKIVSHKTSEQFTTEVLVNADNLLEFYANLQEFD